MGLSETGGGSVISQPCRCVIFARSCLGFYCQFRFCASFRKSFQAPRHMSVSSSMLRLSPYSVEDEKDISASCFARFVEKQRVPVSLFYMIFVICDLLFM